MVFCDEEHYGLIETALKDLTDIKPEVKIADKEEHIIELAKGFSGDTKDFE